MENLMITFDAVTFIPADKTLPAKMRAAMQCEAWLHMYLKRLESMPTLPRTPRSLVSGLSAQQLGSLMDSLSGPLVDAEGKPYCDEPPMLSFWTHPVSYYEQKMRDYFDQRYGRNGTQE